MTLDDRSAQPQGGCGKEGAGSNRVNRGGDWNNDANNATVSNRNNDNPDDSNNNLGFRLGSS